MSRRSMRASVTLVLLTASISTFSIGSHVSANESAGNGGRQSLFADFNGDGFSDLAAGAGAEHVDGVADAGAVHVIYGSPNGLTAAGDDFFTQNTSGISDRAEDADCFGCTTGGGDLNGDGYAELLVGAQAEEVGSAEDAGVVHIIFGS